MSQLLKGDDGSYEYQQQEQSEDISQREKLISMLREQEHFFVNDNSSTLANIVDESTNN